MALCLMSQGSVLLPMANASGHPVQFNEIKSWKPSGPYWEEGFDSKGNLLAIYDLSFPYSGNVGVPVPVKLGVLNTTTETYNSTLNILDETLASNSYLTESKRNQVSKLISQLKKLKLLKKNLGTNVSGSLLPDNWWQTVPWKKARLTLSSKAPETFQLSDIDFQVKNRNYKKFQNELKKFGPSILNQFQFTKIGDGSYDIHWLPEKVDLKSSKKSEYSEVFNLSEPFKVIDFRCSKCGMTPNILFDLLEYSLDVLAGLVPNPVVAGFLNVAFTELFNFRKELVFNHHEMVLEALRTGDEKSRAYFSFDFLSADQRRAAIDYTLYGESNLMTSLRWIITKPETEWKNQIRLEAKKSADASLFLRQHGETLYPLNSKFAIGENLRGEKKLFPLASMIFGFGSSPLSAINYKDPFSIRNQRIAVEAACIFVHFFQAFIPVPAVGPVAMVAYTIAVENPMHDAQHWESRLKTYLRSRVEIGENWDFELKLLALQQINPFEISYLDAEEWVIKQRSALEK